MKNTTYEISSPSLIQANGKFECYNTTEDMVHLVRLGAKGQKLAISAKNLLNIPKGTFNMGIRLGNVKEI